MREWRRWQLITPLLGMKYLNPKSRTNTSPRHLENRSKGHYSTYFGGTGKAHYYKDPCLPPCLPEVRVRCSTSMPEELGTVFLVVEPSKIMFLT